MCSPFWSFKGLFDCSHVGSPGQQRAKMAEVSKFGKAISGCYLQD